MVAKNILPVNWRLKIKKGIESPTRKSSTVFQTKGNYEFNFDKNDLHISMKKYQLPT